MTHEVEELHLRNWQEVTGTCVEIAVVEAGTEIILEVKSKKYRLRLPRIEFKAETLQWQGISVLKTESLEKPFLIRKMDATKTTLHACAAALLHVWLDRKCTADKEFRKRIEWMEQQDRHWRKMTRLWAKLLRARKKRR